MTASDLQLRSIINEARDLGERAADTPERTKALENALSSTCTQPIPRARWSKIAVQLMRSQQNDKIIKN